VILRGESQREILESREVYKVNGGGVRAEERSKDQVIRYVVDVD
jgi:hypothetical protein